tara:strand:+ start:695 stop:1108 length:414 start_codon:yes stop_codon:yes gene_type:complete
MKYKFNLLILILIFIIFIYYYYTNYKVHTFYGKIATTDKMIKNGLMYRKHKLKDKEGMLFNMDYGLNSMWMKNTYIPLDIIFLDNMKVVGYIIDAEPLTEKTLEINKQSNKVLEVNGNTIHKYNIEIGDMISFTEIN